MDNFDLGKLKEKYLGSLFTITEVNFWISPYNGLPYDQEPREVIDEDAGLIDADAEGDQSHSSWFSFWKDLNKKHADYYLNEEQEWIPPPDMYNRGFRSVSKEGSTSSSVASYVASSGVNPIHLGGPELTGGSVGNMDALKEDYFVGIQKYFFQRHILFSKYDAGIKMDEEGWYSATPECIAEHHASRCGEGVVVDCFAGVGGNCIRFALKSSNVIAIDIDPNKIELAKHNAIVYGVDHIDFRTGDCFIVAKELKQADTVFLSPPWGGPKYSTEAKFDMITMLKPCEGKKMFDMAKEISHRVVMYLPRNVDLGQLADIALSTYPPWTLEVEKNFLNGDLKAITAYFNHPSLAS